MEQTRDFVKEALATIRRNKRESLCFYVENFRGANLGHIRIMVPDKTGAVRPTGKGITITREHLSEFAAGLQKLAERLEELAT